MAKTYDEKSYDLAAHFLSDEPDLDTLDNIHHLALAIQETVEDWIETKKINFETQNSDLYSPMVKRVAQQFSNRLLQRRRRERSRG